MALKLRLARAGTKKRPYYHVVVADARSPRDGRFIEKVGTYDPDAGRRQQARDARHRAHPALAERRRAADRPRAALPRHRRPRSSAPPRNNPSAPSRARRPPSASRPRPRPLPTRPPLPPRPPKPRPPSKRWRKPRPSDLLMGRIGAAHGIKGEVRITVVHRRAAGAGGLRSAGHQQARPRRSRSKPPAPPTNVLVARLKGVTDRNAAEKLNGVELYVDRDTPAADRG